MSESSRGNMEQRQEHQQHQQQTRRALIGTAMSSYQKLKAKKLTVVILKGGLALAQVATLVVLLILAAVRRQLDATPECTRPELFEAWMVVNALRLSVCWGVSLWVVYRARPERSEIGDEEQQAGQSQSQSLALARAQRAATTTTDYVDRGRPGAQTCTSSHGSFSTLGKDSTRSSFTTPSPLDSSCSTLGAPLSVPHSEPNSKTIASSPSPSPASSSPTLLNVPPSDPASASASASASRIAALLDRLAPKLSSFLAVLSLTLFITGNILVFSPLPSADTPTCKTASPYLWWGVMAVVAVGWFLLAQIVLIVGVVGIGGSAVMAILRAIHLVAPLPVPLAPREPPPAPLSLDALSSIRQTHYGAHDLHLDPNHASCLVCLNDYVHGDALRVLDCAHCFHPQCIDPWLVKSSARCPACNAAVVSPKADSVSVP